MSVLLTASKKAVQGKPKSARPKKAPKKSAANGGTLAVGGSNPDVPPFSTDKTAVFFFEDYVDGYEVVLMIKHTEIKKPSDSKSAGKYQAGETHNTEKVEVWSSVGCVTFEDNHLRPIDCPGFQEVGNGESILKFKVFLPEGAKDAIDCMVTRHRNPRNAKRRYNHILDWDGRTYVEHTEENMTTVIPAASGIYGDGPPAAAFYSEPPPAYSFSDPFEKKKDL